MEMGSPFLIEHYKILFIALSWDFQKYQQLNKNSNIQESDIALFFSFCS